MRSLRPSAMRQDGPSSLTAPPIARYLSISTSFLYPLWILFFYQVMIFIELDSCALRFFFPSPLYFRSVRTCIKSIYKLCFLHFSLCFFLSLLTRELRRFGASLKWEYNDVHVLWLKSLYGLIYNLKYLKISRSRIAFVLLERMNMKNPIHYVKQFEFTSLGWSACAWVVK